MFNKKLKLLEKRRGDLKHNHLSNCKVWMSLQNSKSPSVWTCSSEMKGKLHLISYHHSRNGNNLIGICPLYTKQFHKHYRTRTQTQKTIFLLRPSQSSQQRQKNILIAIMNKRITARVWRN